MPYWPQLVILTLSGLTILKGVFFAGQVRKFETD